MTDKRPWTGNMKAMQYGEFWYVVDERDRAIVEVISANSEADARLFAAAPALYEALDAAVGVINQLYQKLGTVPADELADITATVIGITAALRAVNPDTFESAEGEGE